MNVKPTYLKDYRAPDFLVEACDLHFELEEEKTLVHASLKLCRSTMQGAHQKPLVLSGESLKLISLHIDDKALLPHEFEVTSTQLTIPHVPDVFILQIVTEIYPHKNTALSGLYRSENLFCTQCEAQGFRRITYYLDRPDVMAPFTTTIVADKSRYPVLLSNGNKVDAGELADHRHWVKWQDPFKKPAYLFALVAGPLVRVSDSYKTLSGKTVQLEIYVEAGNESKCEHALRALQKAMQWDEKAYGREYDLGVYMIVAVNDFNMGAMENKGLNIFNAKYILANEDTATDGDFQMVEAVIGHEYFHNWTGNRVTCRDWFQLSLKEGLTVFREQQFSGETGSPIVKRIQDVNVIRTRQFAEDAGPMAHPVQPDSYIEINNFYTSTIYYKGAEVIRMLHTLLGEAKFRKGMDLYFKRHDGEAVTIESFVAALADANQVDLNQFLRWYRQAGTPEIKGEGKYHSDRKQFVLTLTQSCPETPDKKLKAPFLIPIKIALYDKQGKNIALQSHDSLSHTEKGNYIVLDKATQTFTFDEVPSAPIPSLLGGFSAPVKLTYPYQHSDLILLMTQDEDLFNRWDCAQRIGLEAIYNLMAAYQEDKALVAPADFIEAYKALLHQEITDPHFFAHMLALPSFQYVAETLPMINVAALAAAREALLKERAQALQSEFLAVYERAHRADDGSLSSQSMGHRALKNVCLSNLVCAHHKKGLELAKAQYDAARNMTDRMGALVALNESTDPLREACLEDFYKKWKKDPLVVNKWLSVQASSELPDTLEKVEGLLSHEAFDIANPNKVYALLNAFSANAARFHDKSGRGYTFIADKIIELNQINPQVAARLLGALTQWKRLTVPQGNLMKDALLKVQAAGNLSDDVYEIVTKSL